MKVTGQTKVQQATLCRQISLVTALSYGLAVVIVALAMGLRFALEAWVGPGLPTYVTFYPAMMVVMLLTGFGPGVLATLLMAILTCYWILPPLGSFAIASPVARLGLTIFTGTNLFMCVVSGFYRRSREQAAAYEREAALHESRARLASFAAATFEGIVESDAGKILDCNEQFARMSGYAVDQLKGMQVADLVAPEDHDRVTANIRQRQESVVEHALIRNDGTPLVVEAHGRPVSPGSTLRHTAIRDITQRRQGEEEARQLHEIVKKEKDRLSALVNSITDEIWFADAAGAFTLVNPSASREFALDCAGATDVGGLTSSLEVLRPDGTPRPIEEAPPLRALNGEVVWNQEELVRTPATGELRYRQVNSAPVRDAKGIIIGAVSVVRDITDLKQAEQSAQAHRELLETVVNCLPVGIDVIRGSDLKIQLVNTAYQAIAPGKEMIGKTLDELWPETNKTFVDLCRQVLDTGETHHAVDELFMVSRSPGGELERAYFTWSLYRVRMPGDEGWAILNTSWDTTERMLVQQELRKSEERFRLALKNSPVSVAIQDRNLVYQWAYNQTSRHPDEIIGRTDADLFAPDEVAWINEVKCRVLESGTEEHVEHWVTSKGQRLYLDLSYEPLRNSAGEVTEIGIAVVNLTRQKLAELALKENEERYRLLADTMLQGVVHQDASGKIIAMNPAAESILGKSHEQFLGSSSDQEERDCIRENGERFPGQEQPAMVALQTGLPVHSVIMGVFNPNLDEYRWISIDAVPVFRLDEACAHEVYTVFQDVTERKKSEKALKESEDRLRIALEAVDLGTWDLNLTTGTAVHSLRHDQIFGYQELQPEWTFEIAALHMMPEDQMVFREAFTHAEKSGELFFEARVRWPDGSIHWIAPRGRVYYDDDGRAVRMIGVVADVTESKRADDALKESEARFRSMADAMPQLAWTARADGHIFWYNKRWYDYTGTTPEQMDGWGWQSVHDTSELPMVLERWQASIATGEPFEMTFPLRGADGVLRPFLTRVIPLKDGAGSVLQWFGTNTDVDELKRVEKALRESEAMYRGIGESIDYGVWTCAPDGRNTYASESFLKMVGITQEQCSEFGWGEVLHPDDAERTIAAWRECVRTGGKWDIEHRFRGPDGEWHHVLARGVPIRNEQGEIISWAGINLDINQLKKAEEQLRLTTERFEVALKSSPIVVFNQDLDLRYTWIYNPALGYDTAAVIGKLDSDLFERAEDAARTQAMKNDVIRSGVNQRQEVLIHSEGVERYYDMQVDPLLDQSQRIVGVTCAAIEITERKRAEEQIKVQLAEKEVMLREIHHRVKNNLQVISSLVSLQADTLTDERMRGVFGDVRDRVRAMALVHEKLYQAGDLAQLNFADYTASLLQYLWRSHGALAEKVRLNLAVEAVVLPIEAAVPCGLILNELAGNALKHAFPDGRAGEVTVGLELDTVTGAVCLLVHDTGVGLPADQDWRQSRSLGLRLVQILAGQLHGTVETGTGPGAEFRVVFSLKGLQS